MDIQNMKRIILQTAYDIQQPKPNQYVADTIIAERLGFGIQEVQDCLDLLADQKLVTLSKTFGPEYSAILTPLGRTWLRDPNYPQQQTGSSSPVVNILNIIDSQIQNLTQAGNKAEINQTIDAGLNEDIFRLIDQIVDVVCSSSSDANNKQDYKLEADGLKTELMKSKINLSRVREMLAFLGDVEGTLGLAARLLPYLALLQPLIEKMIGG